ncbi:MAG: ribonuclease R, partial [Rhodopila sp.]
MKPRGKPAPRNNPPPYRGRTPRSSAIRLPETAAVEVIGTDADGDPLARPVDWDRNAGPPPLIRMQPEKPGSPALGPGDRVLARLRPSGHGRYEGRTLRRISETPGRILGIFRHRRQENRIVPTDRRFKAEWIVPRGQEAGAEPDEIVLGEPIATPHHLGLKPARVVERLGKLGDARSISLIAIHTHDIPQVFPDAALDQARRARAV